MASFQSDRLIPGFIIDPVITDKKASLTCAVACVQESGICFEAVLLLSFIVMPFCVSNISVKDLVLFL